MDWFLFGMMMETGQKFYMVILYGTIPNPEGHRLRIFI